MKSNPAFIAWGHYMVRGSKIKVLIMPLGHTYLHKKWLVVYNHSWLEATFFEKEVKTLGLYIEKMHMTHIKIYSTKVWQEYTSNKPMPPPNTYKLSGNGGDHVTGGLMP
jgi:hypothetical protein